MECKLLLHLLKQLIGNSELIDTLWNVNRIGFEKLSAEMRINRYIMECKFC